MATYSFYVILWIVATLREVNDGSRASAEAFLTEATQLLADYKKHDTESGREARAGVWKDEVDLMEAVVQNAQDNLVLLYSWCNVKKVVVGKTK